MNIPKQYSPANIEKKWYDFWMEKKYFHSEPDDREPFTIVIPPPNVTGVLHMGHMLNNTIQDVLVRRARMLGKNTCWVPGTDHASIATEAKVVNKLKNEGIDKRKISRKEFLKHAWEWKEKHGGIILEQLKKLGASCDWERTAFTMDESRYESVINVFVNLYNKGLIYRGVRMVNWDPKALTALSDEEVIYKEVDSKLYYIKYPVEGSKTEYITIATTRPETILADTAVCVNPNDERYKNMQGKKVILPLVEKPLPIIVDEYVDVEFGTGALKITPAHDINDYNLGLKHKLQVIDIFNDNGTLNKEAQLYIGKDRFEVRKEIVEDLKEKGYIEKIEDYKNKVGFSERTDEVIEPKLSLQWFFKMDALAKEALNVVMDDTIKFYPAKFKNVYRHWMENIKDWCISRQLWWGQRIPAYYLPNNEFVVAKNKEDAIEIAKEKFDLPNLKLEDLKQDEDVLDTWFSSWLWPISVFDGIRYPNNKEIQYYYPTNDLITAPDIIFFWVARMIMAGLEYRNKVPFKNVYFTGMVRDKQGRKMSKSLGNSPDPLKLIDKYGADGVRMGMLLCSPAGNDILFDEAQCEQGRNFCNKIWNAFRLIKGWDIDENMEQPANNKAAIKWFEATLYQAIANINQNYSRYRLSDALMAIYKLIWDEFCSWYLELIKPAYQQPIDKPTLVTTILYFKKLVQLLHPFMPFVTEELWQHLKDETDDESIMISRQSGTKEYDEALLKKFNIAKEIVIGIRNFRQEKNIPNKEPLELFIKKNNNEKADTTFDSCIAKLANLGKLAYTGEKKENAKSFIVDTTELFIPFGDKVNVEEEKKKLQEELKYQQGFLKGVMKKLSNERFVNNAPSAVVDKEKQKKADAEARIKVIEEQLKSFS